MSEQKESHDAPTRLAIANCTDVRVLHALKKIPIDEFFSSLQNPSKLRKMQKVLRRALTGKAAGKLPVYSLVLGVGESKEDAIAKLVRDIPSDEFGQRIGLIEAKGNLYVCVPSGSHGHILDKSLMLAGFNEITGVPVYHVTNEENVPTILRDGILPGTQVVGLKNPKAQVHVFVTLEAAEEFRKKRVSPVILDIQLDGISVWNHVASLKAVTEHPIPAGCISRYEGVPGEEIPDDGQ